MTLGSSEQFPKRLRLRKRSEYLLVQNRGVKVHSRAFMALALPNAMCVTRLGITTTKRLGNAVKRNRIKRVVREAFRRGRLRLPEHFDVVVIAKKSAIRLDSASLTDDLETLGGRTIEVGERLS